MDGVEALRKRIQDETESAAQGLLSSANQERYAILTEARREAERITAENAARSERLAKEQAIQRQAESRMASKREILQAKQDVLLGTMAAVGKALKAYTPEQRRALYAAWLQKAGAADQSIVISKTDQGWMPVFLEETYPKLKVDAETGDFAGGFILGDGRTWQDYRFEAVFAQDEKRWLSMAAGILFPENSEGSTADAE